MALPNPSTGTTRSDPDRRKMHRLVHAQKAIKTGQRLRHRPGADLRREIGESGNLRVFEPERSGLTIRAKTDRIRKIGIRRGSNSILADRAICPKRQITTALPCIVYNPPQARSWANKDL